MKPRFLITLKRRDSCLTNRDPATNVPGRLDTNHSADTMRLPGYSLYPWITIFSVARHGSEKTRSAVLGLLIIL